MFSKLRAFTLTTLFFASLASSSALAHQFRSSNCDDHADLWAGKIDLFAPPTVASQTNEQSPQLVAEAKDEEPAPQAAETLTPQEAKMAPTSTQVPPPSAADRQEATTSGPDSGAPGPVQQGKETATRAPLQGHLVRHGLDIRSLPVGLTPDFIIGHFALTIGPFIRIPVNTPLSSSAGFASRFVKKWHGKQMHSCQIKMKKIPDGSGGYYFKTIGHEDGPRGWLMPMPKVVGKDKVTPWGIFFDQPDSEQTPLSK